MRSIGTFTYSVCAFVELSAIGELCYRSVPAHFSSKLCGCPREWLPRDQWVRRLQCEVDQLLNRKGQPYRFCDCPTRNQTIHIFTTQYTTISNLYGIVFVQVMCDLQAENIKKSVESADFCRRWDSILYSPICLHCSCDISIAGQQRLVCHTISEFPWHSTVAIFVNHLSNYSVQYSYWTRTLKWLCAYSSWMIILLLQLTSCCNWFLGWSSGSMGCVCRLFTRNLPCRSKVQCLVL